MKILSPSSIAIQAAGLPLVGSEVVTADHIGERCGVCGATFEVLGEPMDALVLPASFTNHPSLAIPGSKWRCGACTAVMTNPTFQMGASTVLICSEGIYPIVRKEHRAWAFLTPPEPPFVIAIQNAKQQHVVWRSPVTLSQDLFLVRVGEQVMRIRRPLLLRACEEARLLSERNKSKGRPVKDAIENPFVNDWKLQSAQGGRMKSWLQKMLEEGTVTPMDISTLLELNGAEAWAMTAALFEAPIKPEALHISAE